MKIEMEGRAGPIHVNPLEIHKVTENPHGADRCWVYVQGFVWEVNLSPAKAVERINDARLEHALETGEEIDDLEPDGTLAKGYDPCGSCDHPLSSHVIAGAFVSCHCGCRCFNPTPEEDYLK